jgi:hypothetical protein
MGARQQLEYSWSRAIGKLSRSEALQIGSSEFSGKCGVLQRGKSLLELAQNQADNAARGSML